MELRQYTAYQQHAAADGSDAQAAQAAATAACVQLQHSASETADSAPFHASFIAGKALGSRQAYVSFKLNQERVLTYVLHGTIPVV